jgi:hypothetical protein
LWFILYSPSLAGRDIEYLAGGPNHLLHKSMTEWAVQSLHFHSC